MMQLLRTVLQARVVHVRRLVILVLAAIMLIPAVPPARIGAAPPDNFQTTAVVTQGLDGPSGFEIAPDGRIFVLERTGAVKIYKDGKLMPVPFATLPAIAEGDRGLIGIAFDPDFAANCYVYFYYTDKTDLLNRLVRFRACGDTGTDGPYLVYKTDSPSQELHVGGSIAFGNDGKLYLAVGDNGYPPNGQDLSNPHGKILRINKDGSVPADNPFVNQPDKLPEIWAYGFRNPWRFQFDADTGRLYGADVGDYRWEEINVVSRGGNYGWPAKEGDCGTTCDGTIPPIYAYAHDGTGAAVTGGPVYRSNMFPAEYQGDLFFGDYARGFIKRMDLDAAGNNAGVHDFDTAAGSVVDMKIAPDGAMYYITYYPGQLYRVAYDTGNSGPTARSTADVTKGPEPLTVNFSSSGSSDPDGTPLTYSWDLGDGTTSTAANPTKTYSAKGTYNVRLSVSDGQAVSTATPLVIQVGNPPTVRISVPEEGSLYSAGETVTYNAFAEDAAGFDLNDADISTDIVFHHNTHTHPFLDNLIGRAQSFTIPDTGEAAADTWYEIITTVTDSSGLTATDTVRINPRTSALTFDTNVPGLSVTLDGVPYPAPHSITGVVGFKRELSAPAVQTAPDGKVYQFESWSDGGAIRHQFTTPPAAATFTARYVPAAAFKAEYFDNADLAGVPKIVRQEATINNDWGGGSPGAGIPADLFSARYSKDHYFAAGRYKFTAATDDGVRLYVDGKLVINVWTGNNQAHSATLDLAAGTHQIRLEYMEQYGGAHARLNWESTPDQPASVQAGYTAEYFGNASLSGPPAVSRIDTDIQFDWGGGAPAVSMAVDNFSARWSRQVELPAGTYDFTVTADDGVRLFVDDKLVLDKWIDQPPTTYTVPVQLADGSHTIRMEYYEKGGGAVAKMGYQKAADALPSGGYTAKYWNMAAGTAPVIPATAPTLTRQDGAIDFDWGGGSPGPAVTVDNFVAQWTGGMQTVAGTYDFTVTADDGVRLFVDDKLVLDKWIDQPPTTYTVPVQLADGSHTIRMEYYEKGGGAVAKMGYAQATAPAGYTASYWNTPGSGVSPVFPADAPALTRTEATIQHDFGNGSPGPQINADHFAARWTRTVQLETGTYRFTTVSDDGIRIKLGDKIILDRWNDHAPQTDTVDVAVIAGSHQLVIEYYENAGGAVAKFDYLKL